MSDTLYADVIVPQDVAPLTYVVEAQWVEDIAVGSRVLVGLGARKHLAGVVLRLHHHPPTFRTKPIERVIDPQVAVRGEQLRLWTWMADYYLCSMGMVMRAALPAGLKLDGFSLEEAEQSGYQVRKVPHLRLHPSIGNQAALLVVLDGFGRRKAQQRALLEYVDLAGGEAFDYGTPPCLERQRLSASSGVVKALVEGHVLEMVMQEPVVQEVAFAGMADGVTQPNGEGGVGGGVPLPQLTPAQAQALEEIRTGFITKEVALLHGVTGSGKTEIYIHLMAEALAREANVLYLLPEIALTAQLIERLQFYFGDAVCVYHSRLSNDSRARLYRSLLRSGGGRLIVGVRSSVLLPTPGLGLVVVDEEHETSFKQSDGAPRYQARDTAIVLASLYGAKTLLGSATPAVESYYNGVNGKYVFVSLTERYSGVALPEVLISDSMRAAKRGEKSHHFNKLLLERMSETLERGEQVILFQNRRGFSPYMECGGCGWTPSCGECNVTLTYHKSDATLRCHYCGHQRPFPLVCPTCGVSDLQPRGFGTEKIEEALQEFFPQARIDRLDADSTRTARSYQRIISSFERGDTDILVGTQMITKGFDFGNVTLVGILNADNLLNYPDFRASERAFQLMMQVGGRAGRRSLRGTVVIQTTQPDHPILTQVVRGDYLAMAGSQLSERQSFLYPPYCRLIVLTLRHRDRDLLWQAAKWLGDRLRIIFGFRLLGPEAPAVDRVRNQYLLGFTLKIEKQQSVVKAKSLLCTQIEELHVGAEFRSVEVLIDVDPQ